MPYLPYFTYTILYLYYTILYYTILYYTILYYTILYYTILYYTILYYTILYYTILYYTILYTIPYHTIPYHTILYYTIHGTTGYAIRSFCSLFDTCTVHTCTNFLLLRSALQSDASEETAPLFIDHAVADSNITLASRL